MAAPTSVRVETVTLGSTIIRWEYSGANDLGVYRSTNGSSYSLISSPLVDPATDISYTDTGLDSGTLYYYKISDDSGSTFSSVVTITTMQDCLGITQTPGALTRATEAVTPDMFNLIVDHIEHQDNQDQIDEPCVVCVEDGALIFSCLDNCNHFQVIIAENTTVNSISNVGCNECPSVDFLIGPDVTLNICGWPIGCQFDGDECTDAPILGPRIFHSVAGTTQPLGPPLDITKDDCPCQEPITIIPYLQCCNNLDGTTPELCEFSCAANNKIKLKVCGGFSPYTWEVSDNGKLTKIKAAKGNNKISVSLAQPNTPASGVAFAQVGMRIQNQYPTPPSNTNTVGTFGVFVQYLDCNGNLLSNLDEPYETFGGGHIHCNFAAPFNCGAIRIDSITATGFAADGSVSDITIVCHDTITSHTLTTIVNGWSNVDTLTACYYCKPFPCSQCSGPGHLICDPDPSGAAYRQCRCFVNTDRLDLRTADKIAAGCAEPCPEGDDVIVTVTDAFLNSVSVAIAVNA